MTWVFFGYLKDEFSIPQYFLQIDVLNTMLKYSFLELNVGKTKEFVLGNSREREARRSVVIDQREVEMVDSFKYLGTITDKKLTFNEHADMVYKKSQQRLFLLKKTQQL